MKNPDSLAHLKKALEIAGIIIQSENYISSNKILNIYNQIEKDNPSIDDSIVKRSIQTIHSYLNQKIFESKRSKGYRLRQEYKEDISWLLPLFSIYLFLSEIYSLNFVTEPLPVFLNLQSLYLLSLFHYAKNYKQTVYFEYIKYLENKPSLKKVNVYSLQQRGRKLYIIGRDLESNCIKHYIFTGVVRIVKIDEKSSYKLPDREFLNNFYKDSLESYEGSRSVKVLLKVSPDAEIYIQKEYFHNSQKFYRDSENSLLLEMYINNNQELFAVISRFMDSLELLEPTEWRTEYINKLKKALSQYNGFS